jgi:Domain of unknown function (DUF1772)
MKSAGLDAARCRCVGPAFLYGEGRADHSTTKTESVHAHRRSCTRQRSTVHRRGVLRQFRRTARAAKIRWKPAYKRGYIMQSTLAIIGFVLGAAAWWLSGILAFLLGAVLMLTNWPWTLFGIMPTNRILMATELQSAGSASRALLVKWNSLHAVRTGLGACSDAIIPVGAGVGRPRPTAIARRRLSERPCATKERVLQRIPVLDVRRRPDWHICARDALQNLLVDRISRFGAFTAGGTRRTPPF